MHYLFGFSGRINRAKMWLFILVTLGWEVMIGLVAMAGLDWTRQIAAHREVVRGAAHTSIGAVMSLPGPIDTPKEMVTAGVIAILVLLYVVALLAVYTKRLHDRNKGAWWLLLFLVFPVSVQVLGCLASPGLLALGPHFGPLGMGMGVANLVAAILGLWGFIELFFFRGSRGDNRYGPDPLA